MSLGCVGRMSAAAGTHMQSVYWGDSYTFRQKEILCRIGKRRELSPGNRLSVCLHEIKAVWTTEPAVGTSCPLCRSSSRFLFLSAPFYLLIYLLLLLEDIKSTEMPMNLGICFVSNFKNMMKYGVGFFIIGFWVGVFCLFGKRRTWKPCHLSGCIG